jgi:hypothetical protein
MASLAITPKAIPLAVPEDLWAEAACLPCVFTVDAPIRLFTVRDLLQLAAGAILESKNAHGADVPFFVNKQLVGWGEFEVVGQRLAIRLTELA